MTVSKDIKSKDGEQTLGTDNTTSFSTIDAVVVTSFKVGNRTLEQGEFTVAHLTNAPGITLVANKDLDENTVNTSTVKLYNVSDSKFVPAAAVGYAIGTKTISFRANDAETNKVYELRLDGVKALDGTTADGYVQEFAIGSGITPTTSVKNDYTGNTDKVYPGLTGAVLRLGVDNAGTIQSDASNDTNQTLDAFRVTLNFSGRPMDAATLIPANVKLIETDENYVEIAGADVVGTVSYDSNTFTATFTPNEALKDSTYYKFTTTDKIKDVNGIPAVEASALKFKTGDFTAPTIVSSNVDTGTKLTATDKLKVEFDEKMDITNRIVAATGSFNTITGTESVTLHDDTNNAYEQVDIAQDPVDTTGKTVTFIKNGGWDINTTYTLKVKGKNYNNLLSATDLAGNPIAQDYTVTLTTADSSIPTVATVKGFANGYLGTKPNVNLLGSTANNPVVGLNQAATAGATSSSEAVYFYFNREVNGGFTTLTNYQISSDGGKTFTNLPAPTATVPGWAASIVADDNGKNTIVKLLPTESTSTTGDAGSVISGENRYAVKLKKNTATTDNKKLAEDVVVYFSTEQEKPALDATNPLQTYNAASGGALANVAGTTTATMANRGLAIKLVDPGTTNKLLVSTINGDNIKIEDVTASKTLVGAFYEDIDSADAKTLLDTSAGATTADGTIYWYPASDDNKFVAGNQYKVTITGVKDAVGNPMAAPYVKYFTLADTDAPAVVATSVTNGEETVSVDPVFTVEFSKDVTNASATTITLTGAAAVDCDVTYNETTKTATVTPLVYLEKLTQYTLHIDNTITDGTTSIGADTDIVFTTENVVKEAAIQSAVWNEDAKTLTIALDKPVNSGNTLTAADVLTTGNFGAGSPTVTLSLDRKTLVVKADGAGINVVPGVHAVSLLTNGNAVLEDDSNYKQNAANASAITSSNGFTIQ